VTELSDRYRRLLLWYPRDHRADHEEEMLGVLIAAARPGQARPTLRETSDLIRGGLQVRAARAVAGAAGTGWRDALAVAGVLVPLIMSLNALRLGLAWWSSLPDSPFIRAHPDWCAWAIWPFVAVLALCGARRTATIAAMGAIAWWAAIVGEQYLRYDATAAVVAIWWPLLGLVSVVGLAVSQDPRDGVKILRQNKTLLAAAGVLIATGAIIRLLPYFSYETFWVVRDAIGGFAAVVAVALAVSSPVGRRVAVLLSTPVASFLLLYLTGNGGPWSNYPVIGLLLVVPVSLAVFITSALFLGPAERILRLARSGGR
jgi:hypothetical protein